MLMIEHAQRNLFVAKMESIASLQTYSVNGKAVSIRRTVILIEAVRALLSSM